MKQELPTYSPGSRGAGLLMLLLVPFLFSCQRLADREKATIDGQFLHAAGAKVLLQEMDPKELRNLDSALIDRQGKFRFSVPLTEPGFFLLSSSDKGVLVLLLQPGEQPEITGNWSTFPKEIRLTGSPGSEFLGEFFEYSSRNKERLDSLEAILVEKQDDDDFFQVAQALDPLFNAIYEDQRRYEKAFIDRHLQSLASLVALNYAFGLHPVLTWKDDPEYYRKVDSSLSLAFPASKHVVYHRKRVMEYQQGAK